VFTRLPVALGFTVPVTSSVSVPPALRLALLKATVLPAEALLPEQW